MCVGVVGMLCVLVSRWVSLMMIIFNCSRRQIKFRIPFRR